MSNPRVKTDGPKTEHGGEQRTADDAEPPRMHVVATGQQDRTGNGDVGGQLQLEVRVGQVHRDIVA